MSLPPKALHCLAALKRDLLSRTFTAEGAEGAEAHGQSEKTASAELADGRSAGRIDAPGKTLASTSSATSAVKEERRAEVESQQRMRHAKRSKATVASRYYQRREWWTSV